MIVFAWQAVFECMPLINQFGRFGLCYQSLYLVDAIVNVIQFRQYVLIKVIMKIVRLRAVDLKGLHAAAVYRRWTKLLQHTVVGAESDGRSVLAKDLVYFVIQRYHIGVEIAVVIALG
jgi:hypothetical protein